METLVTYNVCVRTADKTTVIASTNDLESARDAFKSISAHSHFPVVIHKKEWHLVSTTPILTSYPEEL